MWHGKGESMRPSGNSKLTRVIIAHRPETIAAADRVVDLEQENRVAMAA